VWHLPVGHLEIVAAIRKMAVQLTTSYPPDSLAIFSPYKSSLKNAMAAGFRRTRKLDATLDPE